MGILNFVRIITIASAFVVVALTSFVTSASVGYYHNREPFVLDNYFTECGSTMPCKWAVCLRDSNEICEYFSNRCTCPESKICRLTGYSQPEGNELLTKEFRCVPNRHLQIRK